MAKTVEIIREHLAELRTKHPHAGDFCFFTDILNLRSILEGGRLLCRSEALSAGLISVDAASPEVLQKTPDWVSGCVRLYFAPATPMLFHVEGIKRVRDKWPHCPRPVYLVFDEQVLGLPSVRISDGNMAVSHTKWWDVTPEAFEKLPFAGIYHRGPTGGARAIVRERHAEVLIPRELSLSLLRRLVFRSEGEAQLATALGVPPTPGVEAVVDPSWFFAPSEGRPFLRAFGPSPKGLSFEHLRHGDYLDRVVMDAGGRVEVKRTTFGSSWSPWQLSPQMASPSLVAAMVAGEQRYFFREYVVAIRRP